LGLFSGSSFDTTLAVPIVGYTTVFSLPLRYNPQEHGSSRSAHRSKEDTMWERLTKTEPPQFCSGWKEIANYLGKSKRTVQRYEHQLQLPVRHPAGKPRGSVIATKAELDGWVKASPILEVFRPSSRDADVKYRDSLSALKQTVAEMTRLRLETAILRQETTILRNKVKLTVKGMCDSIL
jgi:hypothetical protein